ncbi:MAG: 16S rRNA (cytidine(1402)-2'-O)-methyltransferase [Nanobdellota archaeon]
MLYIVATPIGNLEDISERAKNTLKEADYILAEDTRRTRKLLSALSISNRTVSYHDHSPDSKEDRIIEDLSKGKEIALVSDGGTPLVSDPGYRLVRRAREENLDISPIPGPSSVIAALSVAGFPTDRFCFMGFVPKKKKRKFFEDIPDMTTVILESPYRINKTLDLIAEMLPDRKIFIGREMTKKFEEFKRGAAQDIKIEDNRGEITIVIEKRF